MTHTPLHQTYDTSQPWVVYTYPRTDEEADALGGIGLVVCQCAICGETKDVELKLPPTDEPIPATTPHHAERVAFLDAHVHRLQQRAPETWALPLLNPQAHGDTLDILRDVAAKAALAPSS